MIKAFIRGLLLLVSLTGFINCIGQRIDQQHQASLTALKKDTAFKRFQADMKLIMKTAHGSNTNFAQVKSLFGVNRGMLQRLKKKLNFQKLAVAPRSKYVGPNIAKPLAKNVVKTETFTAPYTAKEVYVDGTLSPQEPHPDEQIGKIAWTTMASPGNDENFSPYAHTFRQTIPVPADPIIVAVRIKFHYSYFFTGWDTEDGVLLSNIRINASSNFNSPAYDDIQIHNPTPYMAMWREVSNTEYYQSFDEIHDYTETKDSTFSIEGYVTPGTTLEFRFGMLYHPASWTGSFGAYHYAEYQLKKIVVSFLKAGE